MDGGAVGPNEKLRHRLEPSTGLYIQRPFSEIWVESLASLFHITPNGTRTKDHLLLLPCRNSDTTPSFSNSSDPKDHPGWPSDENKSKKTMKQSNNSAHVPIHRSFVRTDHRVDRRSDVPPGYSLLGGTQSGRGHMSRQDVVAIIEAALLLTSSFDFLEDDEDEDKSQFQNQ